MTPLRWRTVLRWLHCGTDKLRDGAGRPWSRICQISPAVAPEGVGSGWIRFALFDPDLMKLGHGRASCNSRGTRSRSVSTPPEGTQARGNGRSCQHIPHLRLSSSRSEPGTCGVGAPDGGCRPSLELRHNGIVIAHTQPPFSRQHVAANQPGRPRGGHENPVAVVGRQRIRVAPHRSGKRKLGRHRLPAVDQPEYRNRSLIAFGKMSAGFHSVSFHCVSFNVVQGFRIGL